MHQKSSTFSSIAKSYPIALDLRKAFLGGLWLLLSCIGIEFTVYCIGKMYLNLPLIHKTYSLDASYNGFVTFLSIIFTKSYKSVHIWQYREVFQLFRGLCKNGATTLILLNMGIISTWITLWWALLGGAIYRIAAVEVCTEERISIIEALRYSRKRFFSFLGVFLILAFCIFALCFFNIAIGYIGTFAGNIFVSIFWIMCLISSLILFFLILTLLFTPGLMFATIATDDKDKYDAVSRGITFFFHKFWYFLYYQSIAVLYAIPTILIFFTCSIAAWYISIYTVKLGLGENMQNFILLYKTHTIHSKTIVFTLVSGIYSMLIFGFIVSYHVSAKAVIYTLLREKLEGKDTKEIFLEK